MNIAYPYRLLILVLCAPIATACATITKGTHEQVLVVTDPPGASAYTDIPVNARDLSEGYIGCAPTPCEIRMARRAEAVIQINHPDYAPYEAAVFSDNREVRARRERARQALLSDNAKVATGLSSAYLVAGSLDAFGKVLLPATGAGVLVLGSVIYLGAGSGTLVGDATDTLSGASHSIYPNPLAVRLVKDAREYPLDPNVAGVRQRRKTPSPKPPLTYPSQDTP